MTRASPRGMSFEQVCALGVRLPAVERAMSYGTPALKVRGKLLARLKEDDATLVLRATFVVRDHLCRTSPETFFITDHYRDYPWVLVRLAAAEPAVMEQLLEDAWREVAPKRLVAVHESKER